MNEEKIPVSLKLVTEIRDQSRKENMVQETEGFLYAKNNATFLSYNEEIENAGEVQTVVKIQDEKVLIIRTGAVTMKQTFTKGKETEGTYQSPYGKMSMVTKTENIRTSFKNIHNGKLFLTYLLEMQGNQLGRYRMTFSFSSNEA